MRGRKKEISAKRAVISTRITDEQKEFIESNKWIKKDLDKMIRDYLDTLIKFTN